MRKWKSCDICSLSLNEFYFLGLHLAVCCCIYDSLLVSFSAVAYGDVKGTGPLVARRFDN